MLRALEANGSRPPLFETDDDRSFFSVTFFVHEAFAATISQHMHGREQRAGGSRRTREELRAAVLAELSISPASQRELARRLGYKAPSKTLRQVIADLAEEGALEYSTADGSAFAKLAVSGDRRA